MLANKLRTTLFKTLNILPARFGQELYHSLQKMLFKSIDSRITANVKSYETALKILEAHDFQLEGRSIIEIGSGWMPIMPYLFKLEGNCHEVFTYDINEHYDNKYINALNNHFDEAGRPVETGNNGKYHLPSFIKYHPRADMSEVVLPKSADLVFSRFVLEHVAPESISKIHRHLNSLDKGTLVLHLISPSDHRAYTDSSLSYYDFLQYSQQEWNRIQTKFDYHNRLRLPQYIQLFEDTGFEILDIEYDIPEKDSEKHKAFKKLKIHPDYASYSEEELLAGSINILLKNKGKQ
jgi:hypothetical protein